MSKKTYVPFTQVMDFITGQPPAVKAAYLRIVQGLEEKGYIPYPFGEKVENNLFSMRIKSGNNVRVFYVYAEREYIYGVYAYEKKSQKIPIRELNHVRQIIKDQFGE